MRDGEIQKKEGGALVSPVSYFSGIILKKIYFLISQPESALQSFGLDESSSVLN